MKKLSPLLPQKYKRQKTLFSSKVYVGPNDCPCSLVLPVFLESSLLLPQPFDWVCWFWLQCFSPPLLPHLPEHFSDVTFVLGPSRPPEMKLQPQAHGRPYSPLFYCFSPTGMPCFTWWWSVPTGMWFTVAVAFLVPSVGLPSLHQRLSAE